ncbi:MAG: DNA recombination protein RmuC [Rhodospirillales bacterium]|nr:DNA recombination protein RmuC [Rhodospirillales bacterium]
MQNITELLNGFTQLPPEMFYAAGGFILGALVVSLAALLGRQKLLTQNAELKAQLREREIAFDQAGAALDHRFKATAAEALQKSNEAFLQLAQERFKAAQADGAHDLEKRQTTIAEMIKPVHKNLEDMARALEQVKATDTNLREEMRTLNRETARLVGALRDPAAQGRWGEYILEGLLDKSGLIKGVHYHTQVSMQTADGRQRPDAVIDMQDGFKIIIDSKAPVNQFVDQLATDLTEDEYAVLMQGLSKQVKAHVQTLGKKGYWENVDSPDFTVLFLPSEHIYSLALRADPSLVEYAAGANIIIASPTLLMSLLRVVGMSWRQVELAKNAQEISERGSDLYKRLLTFTAHLEKVGKNLQGAMKGYDAAVGSLERQVLPAARKFRELQAGANMAELTEFETIEETPRPLTLTADDEREKKRA